MEVLVRPQSLLAAVLVPSGQWLVQHHTNFPVQTLDGPTAMVDLAADVQHRLRTMRNHTG